MLSSELAGAKNLRATNSLVMSRCKVTKGTIHTGLALRDSIPMEPAISIWPLTILKTRKKCKHPNIYRLILTTMDNHRHLRISPTASSVFTDT